MLATHIQNVRGQNTIFQTLIDFEEKTMRRGRSDNLLQQRNELILHRYYYFVVLKKRQYIDTLHTLSEENFLSTTTLTRIIISQHEYLKEVHRNHPDERDLRGKYPWVVW